MRALPRRDGPNAGRFRPGRRSLERPRKTIAEVRAGAGGATITGAAARQVGAQGKTSLTRNIATAARQNAAARTTIARGAVGAARGAATLRPPGTKGRPLPAGAGKVANLLKGFRQGSAGGGVRGALADLFGAGGLLGEDTDTVVAGLDTPPNSRVWVAANLVPLWTRGLADDQALLSLATDPETHSWVYGGPQLTYPDGTPALAQFWLPAVSLPPEFSPVEPRSLLGREISELDPDDERREQGYGWWLRSPDGWAYVRDYDCENGYNRFPQAPNVDGTITYKYEGRCRSWSDWNGEDVERQVIPVSFDWSTLTPTQAAEWWVYLHLFNDRRVSWKQAPADLWRADMQPIARAGAPTSLPGRAWLDLNFLNAVYSDDPAVNHGIPRLLDDAGRLDFGKLAAFLRAHPEWAPACYLPPGAMLATLYDATGGPSVGLRPGAPLPDAGGGGGGVDEGFPLVTDDTGGQDVGGQDVGLEEPPEPPPEDYLNYGGGGGVYYGGGGVAEDYLNYGAGTPEVAEVVFVDEEEVIFVDDDGNEVVFVDEEGNPVDPETLTLDDLPAGFVAEELD